MVRGGLMGLVCFGLAVVFVATGSGTPGGVYGQIPREPVKWSIQPGQPEHPLKPGDQFPVNLTAEIEEGWHLYSLDQAEGGPTPTRISVPGGQPFAQDGAVASAEPKSAMDPNFNLMTHYYEEEAAFTIPVKVSGNAAAGKANVTISVGFQACSDELCRPPKTVKLSAEVTIAR